MVHLIPVHTTMTATQLSWIYKREIMCLHGLPNTIMSDCDSKFMSHWWQELHHVLGAKLLMLTLFHPQMDEQTECANRSVGQIFQSVIRHDQKDWVEGLGTLYRYDRICHQCKHSGNHKICAVQIKWRIYAIHDKRNMIR